MADVMPDYAVEQQRLRADMASLRNTKERQRLELMDLRSRRQRLVTNILATDEALADLDEKLRLLVEAHGDLVPDDAALMEKW